MNLNGGTVNRILRVARSLWGQYQQSQRQTPAGPSGRTSSEGRGRASSTERRTTGRSGGSGGTGEGWRSGGYPGDFVGRVSATYSPRPDGRPDPGEIVWGWVPYEEDHSQGKDRPVLLVGRDEQYLLGLMLTSKDHTNDREHDPRYLDIGSGPWDPQGRPSEIKVDRVIRLLPESVRREGAVMERATFDRVVSALRS